MDFREEVLTAFDLITQSIVYNDAEMRRAAVDRMFELAQHLIYIQAKAQRAEIPNQDLH